MTTRTHTTVAKRLGWTLVGSLVVLVSVPIGLGPVLGGWVAARRAAGPARGGAAGTVAGLLGALPWAVLVYLASAGAFAPVGYHEGGVHVGINTVPPETLVLWQEVALAVVVATVVAGVAAAGGVVAGLDTDFAGEFRRELSDAN